MQKEMKPKQKLVSLTARHGEESYETICGIADEFKCSKAAVVRASTSGHLDEYFGRLRFYDEKSTKEIKEIFLDILNCANDMRLELSYQGKNLNQLAKLYHVKKRLQDEKDKFNSIADDMKLTRNERKVLLDAQDKQIKETEDEILKLQSDETVINQELFKETADSFISRLDDRILSLEDIVLQKGTRLEE